MFLTCIALSIIAVALCRWVDKNRPTPLLSIGLIGLLLLLPFLQFLPKVHVDFLAANELGSQAETYSNSQSRWFIKASQFIPSIWILGSSLLLLRFTWQNIQLRQYVRESTIVHLDIVEHCSRRLSLRKAPQVGICNKITSPIICGVFKPTIILPVHSRSWSPQTLEMVVLHELGHLKRKDLWGINMANLCCALHWYNPFVWALKKRFMNQCEFACDNEVLSTGANKKDYIHALCDIAQLSSETPAAALGMADKATLRNRVESMIQEGTPPRKLLILSLIVLTSSGSLAFTLIRPSSVEPLNPLPYNSEEIQIRLTANPFPAE